MPNNQYYDDRGNRRRDNDKVRFELIRHIGVLAEKDKGWKREVNLVAWNGGDVKHWKDQCINNLLACLEARD